MVVNFSLEPNRALADSPASYRVILIPAIPNVERNGAASSALAVSGAEVRRLLEDG